MDTFNKLCELAENGNKLKSQYHNIDTVDGMEGIQNILIKYHELGEKIDELNSLIQKELNG